MSGDGGGGGHGGGHGGQGAGHGGYVLPHHDQDSSAQVVSAPPFLDGGDAGIEVVIDHGRAVVYVRAPACGRPPG